MNQEQVLRMFDCDCQECQNQTPEQREKENKMILDDCQHLLDLGVFIEEQNEYHIGPEIKLSKRFLDSYERHKKTQKQIEINDLRRGIVREIYDPKTQTREQYLIGVTLIDFKKDKLDPNCETCVNLCVDKTDRKVFQKLFMDHLIEKHPEKLKMINEECESQNNLIGLVELFLKKKNMEWRSKL